MTDSENTHWILVVKGSIEGCCDVYQDIVAIAVADMHFTKLDDSPMFRKQVHLPPFLSLFLSLSVSPSVYICVLYIRLSIPGRCYEKALRI